MRAHYHNEETEGCTCYGCEFYAAVLATAETPIQTVIRAHYDPLDELFRNAPPPEPLTDADLTVATDEDAARDFVAKGWA